ncbi:chromate transporter [Comamonadaceae bacterium M7527]|nr:chromate transporter [Comamonadaceae bacterium M7527]
MFWSFSRLALQGFGGVVAIVQRELVEHKRWLTPQAFLEEWAVAQVMPGPNVVNLSMMLGGRFFGWTGALAALAGMLVFPTLVVLALAALVANVADHHMAAGAMRGFTAVSAGMIAGAAIRLMPALKDHLLGWQTCAALACLTFIGAALLRLPLMWVLVTVGGTSCALAWWRLLRQAQTASATPATQTDNTHE